MLLVLEGLDGAGKSTQVAMLEKYFTERGLKVKFMHFPRFDAPLFGDLIARFLRGDLGGIDQVHPMLTALLYAEDRRDAAPIIKEWLDQGYCVILDRYLFSNIAFQCAKIDDNTKAQELRDWILDTEYNHFGIPKPDLNLFLDVPLRFVDEKLNQVREGQERDYLKGKKDIHEESISFQSKVREVYLRECESGNLKRINCSDNKGNMLSADQIFKLISNEIS
jgi:dTMP kinase